MAPPSRTSPEGSSPKSMPQHQAERSLVGRGSGTSSTSLKSSQSHPAVRSSEVGSQNTRGPVLVSSSSRGNISHTSLPQAPPPTNSSTARSDSKSSAYTQSSSSSGKLPFAERSQQSVALQSGPQQPGSQRSRPPNGMTVVAPPVSSMAQHPRQTSPALTPPHPTFPDQAAAPKPQPSAPFVNGMSTAATAGPSKVARRPIGVVEGGDMPSLPWAPKDGADARPVRFFFFFFFFKSRTQCILVS